MSEWTKIEQPAEAAETQAPDTAPAEEPVPAAEEPVPVAEEPPVPVQEKPSKPARQSVKKGRHRGAAPLGFLVMALAVIGLISVIVSGVRWIQRATDDAPLRQEIADFLQPVLLQNPTAFSGAAEAAESPSCIKAALWKISDDERIRMRREKDDCRYPSDEQDRLLIPAREVEEAFHALFGADASPNGALFENRDDFSIWYDAENTQYHLPAFAASPYRPVLDTVQRQDNGYRVRVGYVAAGDIAVDEKGDDIEPTPAEATIFQIWTLTDRGDGWILTAVEDDAGQ